MSCLHSVCVTPVLQMFVLRALSCSDSFRVSQLFTGFLLVLEKYLKTPEFECVFYKVLETA